MMELKITADERTLKALEMLALAINAYTADRPKMTAASAITAMEEAKERIQASYAEPAEPDRTEPAAQEEPPEEAPISAEDVKRQAIRMIQGGQRDAVKGLLERYGVARVGDVPDEKLADFKKDLDSLK